jgi:cyclopropane fatty-acyl-phospholipid synthase-like methyltransferase
MNKANEWEAKWASEDFQPRWGNRGVAPEIEQAVAEGWLPASGPVLDIGCGLGDIAVWFARRGYPTLGFDIAESAAQKAREAHAPLLPQLEFMALDACRGPIPDRQYKILIDRGCLHTIPQESVHDYVRTIRSVSAPDARMLLFIRAFRTGRPYADPAETRMLASWVAEAFAGNFAISRHAPTYMDRYAGTQPRHALPGLVFWLVSA